MSEIYDTHPPDLMRQAMPRKHIKVSLTGPNSSHNTMAALNIASGLVGTWEDDLNAARIWIVDSNYGAIRTYHSPQYSWGDALFVGDWAAVRQGYFSFPQLVTFMEEAVAAPDCEVLIIDSISPFYHGPGGLDQTRSEHGHAACQIYVERLLRLLGSAECHIIINSTSVYPCDNEAKGLQHTSFPRHAINYFTHVGRVHETNDKLTWAKSNGTPPDGFVHTGKGSIEYPVTAFWDGNSTETISNLSAWGSQIQFALSEL